MEEWYSVTKQQIIKRGGAGLLARYDNSPSSLVTQNIILVMSGQIQVCEQGTSLVGWKEGSNEVHGQIGWYPQLL